MDGLIRVSFPDIEAVHFESPSQLAELEEWTGGRCEMAHDLTWYSPSGEQHTARPSVPHRSGDWVCKRTNLPSAAHWQEGLFVLDDVTFRALAGM